ncbi:MAG: rRNA adenine N-6-methyltransferase family protein, partial [Promethearchaeota archaeon]
DIKFNRLMRIYNLMKRIYHIYWKKRQIRKWKKSNRKCSPPHFYKASLVKKYAKKFSLDILIETGTGKGNMIQAVLKYFKKIYSIELSSELYNQARKRFLKYDHVKLYHGDSANILPEILSSITKPALFWLDAHYSGGNTARGNIDTPIIKELEAIFRASKYEHVILIDDANFFNGENDFPTLEKLQELIFRYRPTWIFINKDNIIRIHT